MYRFSKRRIVFSRGYFLRANFFQIKLRRFLSLVVVHFSIALKPRTNGSVKIETIGKFAAKVHCCFEGNKI